MPVALALDAIGPENPETVAARGLLAHGKVKVTPQRARPDGLQILEGEIPDRPVTLLLDADGRMLRGKCTCSTTSPEACAGARCRHLQAAPRRQPRVPCSSITRRLVRLAGDLAFACSNLASAPLSAFSSWEAAFVVGASLERSQACF